MSLFKKYSYWVNSGKYSMMQKLVTLLVGLVSFMLLARILGPAGFGVWGIFLMISSIAETARVALVRNAFIRFSHQSPDGGDQTVLQGAALTLSFIISLMIAFLILLSLYPVTHWLDAPELAIMLRWYIATILISSIFSHYEIILNSRMDFRGICYMYCIRQGLLLAMILACFLFKLKIDSEILSIFYLLSFVVGTIVGHLFCRIYINMTLIGIKPAMFRLWHYGKFVFGTNISSMLFRSTDNFIIFRVFGAHMSAFYNACYRISNLVDMPSQVFSDLLFPKVAGINARDLGSVKYMYERTVGAVLVFSLPALLAISLFPETLLLLLAGSQYTSAAPVLQITAFTGFMLPFIKQFGTIMDATGTPNLNFRVMLISVFLNIGTNLLGIYLFGFIGAAAGTALTYLIIFMLTQFILKKKFDINWINTLKWMFRLYREMFTTTRSLIFK